MGYFVSSEATVAAISAGLTALLLTPILVYLRRLIAARHDANPRYRDLPDRRTEATEAIAAAAAGPATTFGQDHADGSRA